MSATLSGPQPGGGAPSPVPPQPGAGPAGGGQPSPVQPPVGSSPATGPTQNFGAIAQANQIAAVLLVAMTAALAKLPPSRLRTAISKAQYEISKELEPGTSSPAGMDNAMRNLAMQQARMRPQLGAMRTQAGGPLPPGGGAAPASGPTP